MRRAWILPALALACSRENPGFLLAEAGAELTTGASSDALTTTPTTPTTTTTTTTTGEPAPLCPTWPEPSLGFSFVSNGQALKHPDDCSQVVIYRGKGTLSTKSLTLTFVDGNGACAQNLDSDFQVTVGYVGIDIDLPVPTDCFEVQVEWAPDCSAVRSVLLRAFSALNMPDTIQWFAAGVVGSASPPPGAPELAATPMLDQACSCDPEGTECCPGAGLEGPGSYRLDFDGAPAPIGPGQSVDITTDTTGYTITNLRTHVHADCIEDPQHLDWYAVRTKFAAP